VVDRSEFVCEWMRSYLPGIDVRHSTGCYLPLLSQSMDAFCAHGVFEHLLAEEIYWFLLEGARVLRPGGKVVFNFDNVATAGGLDHLVENSSPNRVSAFRFHHPDAIAALARRAGFSDVRIETSESRNGFALLTL
jgi:predicted SAM-dependent methyltransferase